MVLVEYWAQNGLEGRPDVKFTKLVKVLSIRGEQLAVGNGSSDKYTSRAVEAV